MKKISLPAPAKINLFLHILGKRPDGYHNIQTAFQFLNFADQLTFSLRTDGEIKLSTCVDIPSEKNLIFRAAKLLQQQADCNFGADITINKQIPLGAGLGGGSSDAATTLLALNQLWQCHYDLGKLAKLGSTLGADVPVFIYGEAAWAEGKGDQLQKISPPEGWCLLIFPPCSVSTEEIYAAQELTRNTPPITISEFLKSGGHNDCEPVVSRRYAEVNQALAWLTNFAPAKMTGTGSCVYAMFTNEQQALATIKQAPQGFKAVVAKAVNQSPAKTPTKIGV